MNNYIESFISNDGTKINYRVLGNGPGLVILGGAFQTSQNYLNLAELLADKYTIYITDRRGRNGSGPQGEDYSIGSECEDAMALLNITKAPFLFGHSYGAIIALDVASQYPLHKVALYEPPLSSVPTDWLSDFERFLEKKDSISAVISMIQGLKLGGPMNYIPRPIFKLLLKAIIKGNQSEDMEKVLHTVPKEIIEVKKQNEKYEKYKNIKTQSLILAGSKSPAYFHKGIGELKSILHKSECIVLQGLDHGAPNEHPQDIANALGDFFI